MTWFEIVPVMGLLAIVLIGPGALLLRAVGITGWLAIGAGPAVSAAVLGVLTFVLARTGIDWTPAPVALLVLGAAGLLWGISTLLGRLRRRVPVAGVDPVADDGIDPPREGHPPAAPAPSSDAPGPVGGRSWRWWLITVLALGTVVTIVPIAIGMGAADAPLQQWDAVFHLNGVALVQETGDASNLNGLYDHPAYYPTVWHAMVSLVVTAGGPLTASSVTGAANASTLVIASLGWLIGLLALARAIFPHRPGIVLLAVALGPAFSMFPTVQLSTLAQWPNALSVMLIPGTMALAITAVTTFRSRRTGSVPRGLVLTVAALVATLGVTMTQATGAVGLAVLLAPFLVAAAGSGLVSAWREGRRTLVVVVVAAVTVALLAVVAFLATSPVVRVVLDFPRAPQRNYAQSVLRLVSDAVLYPVPVNLVVSVAVLIGAVAVFRARAHRWIVVSAAAVVVLAALAAGPEWPLRKLTGIWYTQAARIEALYPIMAVLLAAVGVAVISTWASERFRRREGDRVLGRLRAPTTAVAVVLAVAFVTSLGFQAPQRATRFAQAYEPGRITWGTMLSPEEIALMRRLPEVVGTEAVLIGDPFNGSPYAWSIGRTTVIYPQLNTIDLTPGKSFLLDHFREITTDPRVCTELRALGVTHFYQDTAGPEDGAKMNPGNPGIKDVDVSEGFELLATAGTAGVYRVTACD